jgi:hypothetical protein
MKHLYEYEDEEIKTMMTDLEGVGHGSLKGWLISCMFEGYHNAADGTAYVSIVAENSREAMSSFATLIGNIYSMDAEVLKEALDKTEIDNFALLGKNIFSLDSGSDDDSPFIFNVWEGLIPISKTSYIEERGTDNILYTMEELKKEFTNVESVLRANKKGNYDE